MHVPLIHESWKHANITHAHLQFLFILDDTDTSTNVVQSPKKKKKGLPKDDTDGGVCDDSSRGEFDCFLVDTPASRQVHCRSQDCCPFLCHLPCHFSIYSFPFMSFPK